MGTEFTFDQHVGRVYNPRHQLDVRAERIRRAGRAIHTMAGGSAMETMWKTAARVLIAIGLTGSMCALIGYYRAKATPAKPVASATPAFDRVDSSPSIAYDAAPVHTLSRTMRLTATPLSSPTACPTDMPVLSPTPTIQTIRAVTPSVEPVQGDIVASSKPTPPRVGTTAPDFTLPNAQGGSFTLGGLRDQQGVVLVFYRTTG